MTFARVAVVLVAVLTCAWFGLGAVQAHDTLSAATTLSDQASLSAAQAKSVSSLLSAAGWMNPDTEVDILRARLVLLRGDRNRAAQILEDVVHREPLNIQAWTALAATTAGQPVFSVAIANIKKLDPKIK